MSLGTLQSFIQNFQSGQDRSLQMQDRARQMAAMEALGKMLGGGGPASAPDQAPQAAPGLPAGQSPIQVSAQTRAGLNPEALRGLAVLNGQQPPGPPPAAAGPGPSPAPQPPNPNLSGTAQQPQMGGQMDAVQEAQQNIKAMAAAIKAANPGIDGATLLMAVDHQIEDLKGVAPLTKATMQAQTAALTAQMKYQAAMQGFEAKMRIAKSHDDVLQAIAELKAQTGIEIAGINADSRRDVASTNAGARVQAAGIGAGSRENVARIGADSRRDVANIGADSRESVAGTNAEARMYGADQGFRGNQVRGGGKADPAPRRPNRPARKRPPLSAL